MFPDDPRQIHRIEDLREVAVQMKISANPDDDPQLYSKSETEAAAAWSCENLTDEQYKFFREHGGNRAVFFNGQLLSLCLTTDDNHGHKWHLSLCRIIGPGQATQTTEDVNRIVLDAFFSTWKSVPNPGKMKEILHFVGND